MKPGFAVIAKRILNIRAPLSTNLVVTKKNWVPWLSVTIFFSFSLAPVVILQYLDKETRAPLQPAPEALPLTAHRQQHWWVHGASHPSSGHATGSSSSSSSGAGTCSPAVGIMACCRLRSHPQAGAPLRPLQKPASFLHHVWCCLNPPPDSQYSPSAPTVCSKEQKHPQTTPCFPGTIRLLPVW